MPTVINCRQGGRVSDRLPDILTDILPYKLYGEIIKNDPRIGRIEEIRCRLGRNSYLTCSGGNFELSHISSDDDIERMTERLFDGSLYAHRETLLDGYITLTGGIRVGVCGRAAVENGKIIGIYDISSLNFRLPVSVWSEGEPVADILRKGMSVLVYSPPGVGKTTLLRSVAARMSSGVGALRVSVIDTRGELSLSGKALGGADILLGYPKDRGIEIAARTLNPQLIVCDEIGGEAEAEAIIAAANCGVPILASAHGGSLASLLRRSGIARLHSAYVFSRYVGLTRDGHGSFIYDISSWEDGNGMD